MPPLARFRLIQCETVNGCMNKTLLNSVHIFRVRPSATVRLCTVAILLMTGAIGAAQPEDAAPASDDLFFFRPNTPERQVRGAILAERLDRPDLALGYLNDLIDANPSAEQLRQLRTEFGIGAFLKLSASPLLQPASGELLKMVNEATHEPAPTADAVEVLIQQLGRSQQQTTEAALKILAAEDAAVVPLLAADRETPQGELAAGLLNKYVRRYRRGLVAALPDADESTAVRILNLLSQTAAPELSLDVLPYRFSESPEIAAAAKLALEKLQADPSRGSSREEAVTVFLDEIQRLLTLAGKDFPADSDVLAEQTLARQLSTTSAPQKIAAAEPDTEESAKRPYGSVYLVRAVGLASKAAIVDPNSQAVLAAQVATQAAEQSWPAQWPEVTDADVEDDSIGADTFAEALELAVSTENPGAILPLLVRQNLAVNVAQQHPKLLRESLLCGDVRVRLLAAAVAKRGELTNLLSRQTIKAAVAGSPQPEAVVIDSRAGESSAVAGVLTDMNYRVAARNTGRSGFEAAAAQLQCELILVHSNCLRWSLSDTITNLRADYRTQNSPIIIYGPAAHEETTDTIRTRFRGVWFVPEPISVVTLPDTLRLANFPPPSLSTTERQQMIRFARTLR